MFTFAEGALKIVKDSGFRETNFFVSNLVWYGHQNSFLGFASKLSGVSHIKNANVKYEFLEKSSKNHDFQEFFNFDLKNFPKKNC